ncbi:type II secretion system protein [Campylobacter hyointestinalis]|uniref:type II secretion system protein n=1 Tax=Campylobacter hyointestinalis TaxID=198 RepID=UPI000DCB4F81|nr:type II secretion system protein [Campylobacter hyointestinalis]RAZ56011.1 type II secretion system protein [Campylobacter hyointestinalis subsp. lawsonii]RAZ64478.1 type II secretion system protein [Campylobacter hyointestinalis subsp. lawsonii]
MKRGFSLIMAIVFIVVIITIGMLSFTLSNTSVKQTTEQYLSEQAEALAMSASEYAIYKIQDQNFSKDYLNEVNLTSGVLNAHVSIKYINTKSKSENSNTDFTDKDNKIRAVILTTIVESNPDIIKDQNIRYVRITTQKP